MKLTPEDKLELAHGTHLLYDEADPKWKHVVQQLAQEALDIATELEFANERFDWINEEIVKAGEKYHTTDLPADALPHLVEDFLSLKTRVSR